MAKKLEGENIKMNEKLETTQNLLTKIGPIRKGFHYQDAHAAYVLVSWLKNPKLYNWVRLESDEHGFLDDIICVDRENNIELIQIKFSCHPEAPDDEWTWPDLLKQMPGKRGKKPSLFKKWFLSWNKESGKKLYTNIYPKLITNRKAGKDLIESSEFCKELNGRRVNFKKLKALYKDDFNEVIKQISPASEKELKNFLSHFNFTFDSSDLEAIWTNAERIFFSLGGSQNDWLKFKEQIRKWSIERDPQSFTGKITIEDLRIAAGWIKLRPLNESFIIPNDFVLFNDRVFHHAISEIKKPSGGLQVFWGNAGVGKSTFLSFLNDELKKSNISVLKHHYFIALNDPNFSERLKFKRAEEALKADIFKNFRDKIGNSVNNNPKSISLRTCLKSLSDHFVSKGKTLALILDGLDHVTTYSDRRELKNFLEEIFPCPTGLWIILGTRPIEETNYPPSVFELCPKGKWIKISPFTKKGVAEIIRKNVSSKRLSLVNNRQIHKRFIEKFYQVTEGYPLHVRYSLKKLIDVGNKQPLTERDVEALPPFGGDIEIYYEELWRRLPAEGKHIVILMATADFPLKRKQLLEVLNVQQTTMQLLLNGFEQINHLIKNTTKGFMFFHASFKSYVMSNDEYKSSLTIVRNYLKEWVEKKAPENIHWENLLKLEYDLGNPRPLLKTLTKNWFIHAIKDLRSFLKIEEQLDLGSDAAIKNDDYGTALFFGLMSLKLNNFMLDNEDNYKKLFPLLLRMQKEHALDFIINEDTIPYIPSNRIASILEIVWKHSRDDTMERIFDELNSNFDRDEDEVKGVSLPREEALSRVAAYMQIAPNKVIKHLRHFDNIGQRVRLLSLYCDGLLKTSQMTSLESLLQEKLTQDEKACVLETYAYYCLKEKRDCSKFILGQKSNIRGDNSWLILMLTDKFPKKIQLSLPEYEKFPYKLKDYPSDEKATLEKNFYECYFSALSLAFNGREDVAEKWVVNFSSSNWSKEAAVFLVKLGKLHGEAIAKKESLNYDWLVLEVKKLKVVIWSEDRGAYQIFLAFKESLERIFDLIKAVNFWLHGKHEIEERVFQNYCNSDFFGKERMLKNLVNEKQQFLALDVCVNFIKNEELAMKNKITYFPERAERYIDLALLAEMYGQDNTRDKLIEKAILNMLGYGYHKDLYHLNVLECITSCSKAGSVKGKIWLEKMAPLIGEVGNYTDGDETGSLPEDLADAYVYVDPERIKNYYIYNANEENLFLAEKIFPYLIESICVNKPFDMFLLHTAISKESISRLEKLAAEGNHIADQVLKEQEQYFLSLDHYPRENERLGTSSSFLGDKPGVNYDDVLPEKLIGELTKMENLYEKNKFIKSWASCWLAKTGKEKESYDAINEWIELIDVEEADYEILDLLYPLALKYEGKEKSFFVLCQAHLRGYGWSGRFFSREETVLKRWEYMKKNYPEKVKDFLRQTLTKTKRNNRGNFETFLPVPRGVEFFTYFGMLKEAESMTEMAVRFAQDLMADLELPKPSWVNNALVDSLDLLFSRLIWPSPIVRERAASALSVMLENKELAEEVLTRLLDWSVKQSLESVTVISLLPIVKYAKRIGKNSHIKYEVIKKGVVKPSIPSEFLLQEIAISFDEQALKDEQFVEAKEPSNLMSCPKDHVPGTFFLRSIKGFLPPISYSRAERITKKTGFDFLKQWSWEAECIQKELGVAEEYGDAMSFMGGQYKPIMPGMSTRMSEIYKSAFLRTLFICSKFAIMPKDVLLEWSFSICPIDLTFWEIKSQHPPKWWPSLYEQSEEGLDISKSGIWGSLEKIVSDSKTSNKIIALDGPAKPFNNWPEKDLDTTITLIPFAYKTKGASLPNGYEISEKLGYGPVCNLSPDSKHPFSFFQRGNKYHIVPNDNHYIFNDLAIFPLVVRLKTLTINFWQLVKEYHAPFGLASSMFSQEIEMQQRLNSWTFSSKNKEIARACNWSLGIAERREQELDIPSGQIIEIDGDWLCRILKTQKLRLGYMAKVKIIFKDRFYDKAKVYEETKLLGVSPIII